MSVTLVNSNGHMLRNPNTNSWNEEGKYEGKPIIPWTFADKNFQEGHAVGTLLKAIEKLNAAGNNDKFTVKQVEGNPRVKKEKPAPEPEENIEDFPEEEEVDEWELFKKHGLNKKCMACVNCEKCGQAGCTEIIRCPQFSQKTPLARDSKAHEIIITKKIREALAQF